MKVVVDANIIISGLRFSGMPRRLLEAINKGDYAGFTSSIAMQEIEDVLLKKFKVLLPEWIIIAEVLRDSLVVVPTPEFPIVPALRDKQDLHILAAAETCAADYIISGDKDFLVLGEYKRIPIIQINDSIVQFGSKQQSLAMQ